MNFSQWDMTVIVVMTIAIISMSYVFPALGLTGQNAEENDIPEFNTTADQYEYRGQFPSNPGAPSKGVLHWDEAEPQSEPSQSIFLDGDTSNGTEISVINSNNVSDPELLVVITNYTNGGGVVEDQATLSDVGDSAKLNYTSWTVVYEFSRQRNVGTADFTAQVDFTVSDQPGGTSWYDRTPIVGDIFAAGEALAAIVGWIGSILFWIMGTIISIIWQTVATLLDILTYVFGMIHWMTTAYFGLVSGTSTWASVFVLIPGVILFVELVKLAFIGVDLVWIG